MKLLEHEGKTYLALKAHEATFDVLDDFDVFTVEVTVDVVDGWMQKVKLAETLKASHNVAAIEFYDDSGDWRPADFDSETEPLDEDGLLPPKWTAEPSRTECDRLAVSHAGLEWNALVKHADIEVRTAFLYKNQIEEVLVALAPAPQEGADESR